MKKNIFVVLIATMCLCLVGVQDSYAIRARPSPSPTPTPVMPPPPSECHIDPSRPESSYCNICPTTMGMPTGGTCKECISDCLKAWPPSTYPSVSWSTCAGFCVSVAKLGCDAMYKLCIAQPTDTERKMCLMLYIDYCGGK